MKHSANALLLAASAAALVTACAQGPAPVSTVSLDPSLVALGKDEYHRCDGCHSVERGGRSAAGPNLFGVIGRRAGSFGDYPFSPALRQSAIVWDRETLDLFLADPSGYLPGSDMREGTVLEPQSRAAIIAYLASLSGSE